MQTFFHHQQLGPFGFQHPRHRHTGPQTDDLGDLVLGHFASQQTPGFFFAPGTFARRIGLIALLQLGQSRLQLGSAFLHLQHFTVHVFRVFATQLPLLGFAIERRETMLQRLHFLLDGLNVVQTHFFGFPLRPQIGQLLLHRFHFGFDLGPLADRRRFGFVDQLSMGQFQLPQPTLQTIDRFGNRFFFHRQTAGRFVDQIDRFVGQKTIGDVTIR